MSIRTAMLAAAAIAILAATARVAAHPVADEALAVLARRATAPPDAAHYLRRGALLAARGRWNAALADYARAARTDPDLLGLDLLRGEAWLAAGEPARAVTHLDRHLDARPDSARALLARARARARLGRHRAAARDYRRAIASPATPPALYLEAAQALARAGRPDDALAVLDTGIGRRGPLTVLERAAIALELERGHRDAALARLDRLATGPAAEVWLVWRGDILVEAGRPDRAGAAYRAALRALGARPARRRASAAAQALERRLHASLRGLAAGQCGDDGGGLVTAAEGP